MKKLVVGILSASIFAFSSLVAHAGSTYVNGYYRSDGTYVQGHYRSTPNNTVTDNYSYKGNKNPYTGKEGTNTYGCWPNCK